MLSPRIASGSVTHAESGIAETFCPLANVLGISGFMAYLNSPRYFKKSSIPRTSIFMETGGVLGNERVRILQLSSSFQFGPLMSLSKQVGRSQASAPARL